MSFENLFSILPEGFILKKLIVAYTIFENMVLWRFVELFIQMLKKYNERRTLIIIVAKIIAL